MDFAIGAMIVSVAIESATYGLAAAAAQLGAAHAEGMVAIEWAAGMMNHMVFGGIGLSVLCSAWAMWRSGMFPMVLSILGIIGGAGVTLMAVFAVPAFAAVFDILGISVLLFWIWMLWTGVVFWLRTPKQTAAAADVPVVAR